ncbi:UNVERIFIED_ORG: hypothetical protein ABIB21_000719 [Arthrobacter sp. UYEF13]
MSANGAVGLTNAGRLMYTTAKACCISSRGDSGRHGPVHVDLAHQQAARLVAEGAPSARRELHQRNRHAGATSWQRRKVPRTRGKPDY